MSGIFCAQTLYKGYQHGGYLEKDHLINSGSPCPLMLPHKVSAKFWRSCWNYGKGPNSLQRLSAWWLSWILEQNHLNNSGSPCPLMPWIKFQLNSGRVVENDGSWSNLFAKVISIVAILDIGTKPLEQFWFTMSLNALDKVSAISYLWFGRVFENVKI